VLVLMSVAMMLLLSACGGDDPVVSRGEDTQPDISNQPEEPDEALAEQSGPSAPVGTPVAQPESTDLGAPVGTAVVMIGEQRYEINIDLEAGDQCDPDFFGGFLVVAAEFGGTGTVVSGQFLPRDMGGVGALTVQDRFNQLEWVADAATIRFGFEYPRGRSQVDSWSQDGSVITGKATFTDATAVFAWIAAGSAPGQEPAPVTGAFAISCLPKVANGEADGPGT